MADSSCSHWWHAPLYVALSVALAFVAISTGLHSTTTTTNNPQSALAIHHHNLSFNASLALRHGGGFNVFAALLQFSPEIFLSPPQSTVFAVKDSAFSSSLPPWAIKQLLLYHTSPSRIPFKSLLKFSPGNCVSTLLSDRSVKITKIDQEQSSVEINNVKITHPDLFIGKSLTVHGVSGFFSSISDEKEGKETREIIQYNCNENSQLEWSRIVQLLSSNGFVSYAIGLYSVLDGIAIDHVNLSSVTIFAPPSLGFLSSPSPLLDRVVKLHLVPGKYSFEELSSLPQRTAMKTLFPGAEIEINFDNFTRSLGVNGVEITAPDVLQSNNFTIHGISRALGEDDHLLNRIV